jgi:hypothetical protein
MSGCPVKRFKLPDYFNRLFHEVEKPGSLLEAGSVAEKPILLDPTSVVSLATGPQDDPLFLASPDLSSVVSVTSIHGPLTPESQVDALSIIHPPSKQSQVQGQPTVTQSNKANSQALVSTEILELQPEFLLKSSEETLVSSPSVFNFSIPTEALEKKGNPPCALVSGEGAEWSVRLCGVELRNVAHHHVWGHHVRRAWRHHILSGKLLKTLYRILTQLVIRFCVIKSFWECML